MSTYILTSMFPDGIGEQIAGRLRDIITRRERFAFVVSEFEDGYEANDGYFAFFLDMLRRAGIEFGSAYVVDGRMTPTQAQTAVRQADVVWLSGGDTPTQFGYFEKYGLSDILRQYPGVIIGMSAGSINLAETAVCTLTCEHSRQEIYPALGCVAISVEPHFVRAQITDELIELSHKYDIYGLCDGAAIIIIDDESIEFFEETYLLCGGKVLRIS